MKVETLDVLNLEEISSTSTPRIKMLTMIAVVVVVTVTESVCGFFNVF